MFSCFCSCSNKTTIHCYNESTKNIIYKGLVNPLNISSNKKIVSITSDYGILEKGSTNEKYNIITNQSEALFVEVKTKNKSEKFHFKVKEIPDPILNFNRPVKNNEIKIDDFKTIKNIFCYFPEISIDVPLKISSLEIIRISKDNLVTRENGKVVDSKLIPIAEVGDIFIFNNIIIEIGDTEKVIIKNEILKII
jgi:hypothetical protein